MSFQTNLDNYLNFNSINRSNNNNIEDYFKSDTKFSDEIGVELADIKANSKFNINGYKSIINTTVLSDMFVSRDESNFYPEVGMIFLKTYMKQLIDGEMLQPTNIVKVFNKNQELIELPYSIVLYLGGLYYFNLAESEQTKYKKSQKEEIKLFERIDGVKGSETFLENTYEFEIKKNLNNVEKIKLPNIIPPIGYGIQNNFLNKYNKALFGDYLNGENELNSFNENKPHVLSAAYLGIIKPINTYSSIGSNDDYVALYRSLCVNNYNFSTQSLVSEFSSATTSLNGETLTQNNINKIVKSFIVYCKLKSNFLSNIYNTKDSLKNVINEISKIKNIKNTGIALSDFYFLLSRVFFKNSVNIKSVNGGFLTGIGLNKYNKNIPTLDDADQINSIVNLLYEIWSNEKNNLKNETYSQINDKSVYALYPSCGGFINPNYFNYDKNALSQFYSIKKNTSRFLWFESNRLGLDLINDERYKFDGVDEAIEDNYFSNNHLSVDNIATNKKKKFTNYIEYYKLNHLMDSLDFEKLDQMKNLFKDFVTFNKSEYIVDSYNLKSLILASSVVTYDDIIDLRDNKSGLTITKEELNLMLIGNSMYHYNFISEYGIGKYLNSALTIAQKTKAEDVCNDFCGDLITVANTSTIGSIRYDSLPELSIHKFQTSPEILFSNAKNYDELVTFLGNQINVDKYLSRRILFNNQYLDPFTELTPDEKNSIKNLNEVYLYNKLYILKDDDYTKELHFEIVREFFRFLNIKYSSLTYKHLFKLIRTFSYNCLKELKFLDERRLPSIIVPDYDTFTNSDKILYDKDALVQRERIVTELGVINVPIRPPGI